MRKLAAATLLLLLAGCSTLEVHTDHDPAADFSKYHSYAWAPDSTVNAAPDISGVPSPLIEKRIRDAVDARMQAKGFKRVEPGENPDFLVIDRVTQRQKVESSGSGLGFGWGMGYGNWAAGVATPAYDVRQFTQGTLVIDFLDGKSGKLFWRGIASDVVEEPEKAGTRIKDAVAETLDRYPPEKKSG